MIGRSTAKTFRANTPTLKQSRIFVIGEHLLITPAHPIKRLIWFFHPEKRLQHIFLHIRASMFLLAQHLQQSRILIFRGQSRDHRHRLGPIVRLPLIVGRAIGTTRPIALVEISRQITHHPIDPLHIRHLAQLNGKSTLRLQGQIIPAIGQDTQVDMLTPIAPVPVSGPNDRQSLVVHLPHLVQITVHTIINIRHERTVATIIILCIKPIPTHRGQHLQRQLLAPVGRRHGREDHPIGPLPVHQLMDALHRQLMARG